MILKKKSGCFDRQLPSPLFLGLQSRRAARNTLLGSGWTRQGRGGRTGVILPFSIEGFHSHADFAG